VALKLQAAAAEKIHPLPTFHRLSKQGGPP
jgi:hypothetical protein